MSSGSFKVSASIGSHVIAEDVLFTSSHPSLHTFDGSWTKNPNYAPISSVPLKVGVLNQFRRNARAVSGENESLADIQALEGDFKKIKERITNLDASNYDIREFISQNRKVQE